MYLRLGGGKLGGAVLRRGGELSNLGLGTIELGGEGGVALLEEGAGLLGRDRGGVCLGPNGVHLTPELADGRISPLGDGRRVAAKEPELLVGHEQRHRRGKGRPDPSPPGIAGWVQTMLGFGDRHGEVRWWWRKGASGGSRMEWKNGDGARRGAA
jgi:hypothetical protein